MDLLLLHVQGVCTAREGFHYIAKRPIIRGIWNEKLSQATSDIGIVDA
jgi:hypothetical protein